MVYLKHFTHKQM